MKKILSLVLTLFVSSFVFAAPPTQDKQNMKHQSIEKHFIQATVDFEKIAKELNITDDQKQKINGLMRADLKKKHNLRQQIKQKTEAIDEELLRQQVDMNKVTGLATEIQQLNAEISKINIESKINVRNVLSYDQYSRMEMGRRQVMEKYKQEREKKQAQEQQNKK